MHKISAFICLFKLSQHYHSRLLFYFLISLSSRLVVPVSALIVSQIIDSSNNYLLAILSPIGAFLLVRLIGWGLNFLSRFIWIKLMTNFASEIVKKSFSYLLHMNIKDILKHKPQEWSAIIDINNDVRNIVSFIFNHILPIFFEIILTLIFLLHLNMPIQTIIVLGTSLIYIFISVGLSTKITGATRKFINANIQKNIKTTQFIQSIFLTKTYGAEKNIANNFEKNIHIEMTNTINQYKITVFMDNILTLLICLSMSLIFTISYFDLQNKTITLGAFAAIISMATSIFAQLSSIEYAFRASMDGLEKISPILNIIEQNKFNKEKEEYIYPMSQDEIHTLNVSSLQSQHFDCDEYILKNFSYIFKKGDPVFLVGASGSGKTTFLKSLLNICNSSANITINNYDIHMCDLKNYCAWVDQDTLFVGATVEEDFHLFCPNATEEDIINSLKQAQIWDMVQSKGGIHAKINDVTSTISGGQKQRLSIARALCSNKPILLLDEPTSSLDLLTEKEILHLFMNLNKIIIITMHRLKSIPSNSTMIVMDNGTITHTGKAEEILLHSEWLQSIYQENL